MIDWFLYSHIASWIIHFIIFLILQKFSGIKWQWALIIVFGIEVWEMLNWSIDDPLAWFATLDTWMDIFAGSFGIVIAYNMNRFRRNNWNG